VEVASLVKDGFLADIQDGALGCREGELFEFVAQGEELTNQSFAVDQDFVG
jgi:hypothetical protein